MTTENSPVDRRTVLGSVGTATLVALAGCVGGADDSDDGAGDDTDEEPAHDLPARGLVYGFTDESIVAVDPADQEVIEIEQLSNAISGDIFVGPDSLFAVDGRIDQVHAVDLDTATVDATVDVSGDPSHGFYDETTARAYVHADEEATLYGFDGTDPSGVEATIDLAASGHGKLVVTGDGRALVTNVTAGGLFVVDLEAETAEHLEFGDDDHDHDHDHDHRSLSNGRGADSTVELLHDDGDDGHGHSHGDGTHYLQYSPESGLAFVEETSSDETAVVDVGDTEVVDRLSISGALYLSDDGELLAIIDGEEVHLVDATTRDADVLASVPVGDSPGVTRFTDDYVLTLATGSGDVAVIDRSDFEEIDRISVGDGLDDEGPIGDGLLVTVDGETVSAIDIADREIEFEVEIPNLERVQYVPEETSILRDGRY